MGFLKSLKGNHPDTIGGTPSQPKQEHEQSASSEQNYAPPSGPPPSQQPQYSSPTGPLPGKADFLPPPGPPPSHNNAHKSDAIPYHDWTAVPDTALLPPPPGFNHESSPSSNANLSDADRAHDWCRVHQLVRPHKPTTAQAEHVANGDVGLMKPKEYSGDLLALGNGSWKGISRTGRRDACLLTTSPLYFAALDSPLVSTRSKTVYFEVKINSFGRGHGADESTLALGFCAMPYPTWRMPGWERGSLAVHSDDGRRYVNNTWGGKDFTQPFKLGDTMGIGMSFLISDAPPDYDALPSTGASTVVEILFTRNGSKVGGWHLHEELDNDKDKDLGVEGLDGRFDLYGAIGVFGSIDFTTSFNSKDWLWQPR